jgi:hypothetical protein
MMCKRPRRCSMNSCEGHQCHRRIFFSRRTQVWVWWVDGNVISPVVRATRRVARYPTECRVAERT